MSPTDGLALHPQPSFVAVKCLEFNRLKSNLLFTIHREPESVHPVAPVLNGIPRLAQPARHTFEIRRGCPTAIHSPANLVQVRCISTVDCRNWSGCRCQRSAKQAAVSLFRTTRAPVMAMVVVVGLHNVVAVKRVLQKVNRIPFSPREDFEASEFLFLLLLVTRLMAAPFIEQEATNKPPIAHVVAAPLPSHPSPSVCSARLPLLIRKLRFVCRCRSSSSSCCNCLDSCGYSSSLHLLLLPGIVIYLTLHFVEFSDHWL